ncbi:MAG: hypothetical protein ACRC1H_12260, partial [Caldilineaceae bacterium]
MSDQASGSARATGVASVAGNGADADAAKVVTDVVTDGATTAPDIQPGTVIEDAAMPPVPAQPSPSPSPVTATLTGPPRAAAATATSPAASNASAAGSSSTIAPKAASGVTTDRQSAIPNAADG